MGNLSGESREQIRKHKVTRFRSVAYARQLGLLVNTLGSHLKSPKVVFSHRKMFSRSRFFFLASQERPSRRVRTYRDRHFDRLSRLMT